MRMSAAYLTIERIDCNNCRQNTRHQLLHKVEDTDTEDLGEGAPIVDYAITFETFQCCGCGTVILRHTVTCDAIEQWNSVQYFPPAVSRHPPSWAYQCPTDVKAVM